MDKPTEAAPRCAGCYKLLTEQERDKVFGEFCAGCVESGVEASMRVKDRRKRMEAGPDRMCSVCGKDSDYLLWCRNTETGAEKAICPVCMIQAKKPHNWQIVTGAAQTGEMAGCQITNPEDAYPPAGPDHVCAFCGGDVDDGPYVRDKEYALRPRGSARDVEYKLACRNCVRDLAETHELTPVQHTMGPKMKARLAKRREALHTNAEVVMAVSKELRSKIMPPEPFNFIKCGAPVIHFDGMKSPEIGLLGGTPILQVKREIREEKSKEADPTGRKPSDPGAKMDAGKVRMGLVLGGFSRALEAIAKVGTFGAAKYTDNGWMEVPDGINRYEDALLRHTFKHLGGEEVDKDSGLAHLAHRAWNSLATLELALRKKENDGILLPGKTREVAGEAPRAD